MNIWVLDGRGEPNVYFKSFGSALAYLEAKNERIVESQVYDNDWTIKTTKSTYDLYEEEVIE